MESGRDLLTIYDLLFGARLQQKELIAAHYTLDTDLNPMHAVQYEKDSFKLLNKEAADLSLSVD